MGKAWSERNVSEPTAQVALRVGNLIARFEIAGRK